MNADLFICENLPPIPLVGLRRRFAEPLLVAGGMYTQVVGCILGTLTNFLICVIVTSIFGLEELCLTLGDWRRSGGLAADSSVASQSLHSTFPHRVKGLWLPAF